LFTLQIAPDLDFGILAYRTAVLTRLWEYSHALMFYKSLEHGMLIDPCIPANWQEFAVHRQWRGATYTIVVKNPASEQKGVKTITLN
jgi:N,N'-diacetylchitobiose phosphorylase